MKEPRRRERTKIVIAKRRRLLHPWRPHNLRIIHLSPLLPPEEESACRDVAGRLDVLKVELREAGVHEAKDLLHAGVLLGVASEPFDEVPATVHPPARLGSADRRQGVVAHIVSPMGPFCRSPRWIRGRRSTPPAPTGPAVSAAEAGIDPPGRRWSTGPARCGRGVILMAVTIGEHAVIADRSVVQHDVAPRAWVAGCPARAVPPPRDFAR